MPEVTIDTNIYVSALVYKGTPARLLQLAIDGKIEVAISQPILDETRRVLGTKFGWAPDRIDAAEMLIRSFTRYVSPSETADVVKDDPTDNRIVDCAIASGSRYIISGDRHLLRLGQHGGIKVMQVSDFLRESQPGDPE